jgi:hypothetical protein
MRCGTKRSVAGRCDARTSSDGWFAIWQIVFVSFAVVLVFFEAVRGWRFGVLRQLMRLAGLVAAYAAAFFGGRLLLPIARPLFENA